MGPKIQPAKITESFSKVLHPSRGKRELRNMYSLLHTRTVAHIYVRSNVMFDITSVSGEAMFTPPLSALVAEKVTVFTFNACSEISVTSCFGQIG